MKYSGDRAENHPYKNPRFWLDPSNHFWKDGRHGKQDYFNKFLRAQKKELERTGKIL